MNAIEKYPSSQTHVAIGLVTPAYTRFVQMSGTND